MVMNEAGTAPLHPMCTSFLSVAGAKKGFRIVSRYGHTTGELLSSRHAPRCMHVLWRHFPQLRYPFVYVFPLWIIILRGSILMCQPSCVKLQNL